MIRLLIYIFPAIMDMVLGSVMFLTTVRMAQSGASATTVTLLMTTWSFVYMVCSFSLSRIITSRNAAWLIIASGLIIAGDSLGFILVPGLYQMYLLVVIVAIANAMFFAPFQIFMKAVEQGRPAGVVRSTALYTFAWSTGIALGPFISGYLWTLAGWNWCHLVNICFALLTVIGIFLLKHHAQPDGQRASSISEKQPASGDESTINEFDEYANMPDLAWLAWVGAGLGIFVIMLVRGILPMTGVSLKIPRPQLGTIFALISMTQAIVGLSFIKGKMWMFRVKPIIAFGIVGLLGMIGFAFARHLYFLYISAICLGVYSGAIFFYFVFHSLVHPTKAPKYIAINEAVVGLVGIVGPLFGGLIVDHFSLTTAYLAGAIIIAGAMIFKANVHHRKLTAFGK